MRGQLLVTLGVLMFQPQWKQAELKSQRCGSTLSVWVVKLQTLRLCLAEKCPLQPPSSLFIFILSPLIKLKRDIGSVWGCSVGGKARGRNDRNVKNPWFSPTVSTKMPHHHVSIWQLLFFTSLFLHQFTYNIRGDRMENSFQYCQIKIDLYVFRQPTT